MSGLRPDRRLKAGGSQDWLHNKNRVELVYIPGKRP